MVFNKKEYYKTKRGRIAKNLSQTKYYAAKHNIPFNLDMDYVLSIVTECCPVFGTRFEWEREGAINDRTPSMDKIVPELGYVKGNIVFISKLANSIKQDATEKELYAVADWLHDKRKEVLYAFKDELARLSVERTGEGQDNSQLGTVHGAGVGQDCDGAHHHTGEPEGQDVGDSTEEGCRICMGTGVRKVATLTDFYSDKDNGDALCSSEELAKRLRCICYQRGEPSVVGGQLAG